VKKTCSIEHLEMALHYTTLQHTLSRYITLLLVGNSTTLSTDSEAAQ
jgi:hypothetical protein